MRLQIGDNLRTVNNDQLVYKKCRDIALTLLKIEDIASS